MSIRNASRIDSVVCDNFDDVSEEGLRLWQLLERTRYAQQDLATVCGVTRAAVGRWVRMKTFPDRVWRRIADGLDKLGLNPAEVRSEYENRASGAREDLSQLIEHWPRAYLVTLDRIVHADVESRDRLAHFLKGALRRFKD